MNKLRGIALVLVLAAGGAACNLYFNEPRGGGGGGPDGGSRCGLGGVCGDAGIIVTGYDGGEVLPGDGGWGYPDAANYYPDAGICHNDGGEYQNDAAYVPDARMGH